MNDRAVPDLSDLYCVHVQRFGALGVEEHNHREHVLTREQVDELVQQHLETLCPADRAVITITRGLQTPR